MDPIKDASENVKQIIIALGRLSISATPDNVNTMAFVFARLSEVGTVLASIVKATEEDDKNVGES